MKIENNFENSPFYVKYNGTTNYKKNTIAFHPKQDFNKHLREFFKSRFGDDAKDGEILEQIISDYYFRYAHERIYYGKTIVALMHEKHLASANPTIIPMMVLDRFVKDYKHNKIIDENVITNNRSPLIDCVAVMESFKDVDDELQKKLVSTIFSDGFESSGYSIFQEMKNFNEDRLNEFIVFEIPLNNYLDAYLNGVYCYEDDITGDAVESMHVGLGIVLDDVKDGDATPIPLIYRWSLESDFGVDALSTLVSKVSLDELHELCQKYHQIMFAGLKFFEMYNFKDKDRLKENRQKQAKLQDELELLKQQEQFLLKNLNDESADDN